MSPSDEKARARAGEPEQAEAPHGVYRVELPMFEGPLDLLLHLIQQHELDILDIPIGFIAKKYVEFIMLMSELNVDLASEYLVMAATLAHIKSKTLLPAAPDDEESEPEEEGDPRAELVRRLLEYQKYKLAGEELAGRSVLGRDVFGHAPVTAPVDGPAPLAKMEIFKLLEAFQGVLTRHSVETPRFIDVDRLSITERIHQVTDVLRGRQRVAFLDLFEGQQDRGELIVTFLALLEMTRLRLIRLEQVAPLEPLFIELAVSEHDPAAEAEPLEGDSDEVGHDQDTPQDEVPTYGTEEETQTLPE